MTEHRPPEAVVADPGLGPRVEQAMSRVTPAIIGTVDHDGTPQMVPIMFHYEHDSIVMPTNGRTRKATNLRARPTATVLVELANHTGWVAAKGTAQLVEGEAAHPLIELVASKYTTEEGLEMYKAAAVDDTAIVVTPASWRSWAIDNAIPTFEAAGYSAEAMATGFKPMES